LCDSSGIKTILSGNAPDLWFFPASGGARFVEGFSGINFKKLVGHGKYCVIIGNFVVGEDEPMKQPTLIK
jgi:hypothetical protein